MNNFIDLNNYVTPFPSDDGMKEYYDLLKPLISALDQYVLNSANHISHVYVTGHSLGGAMVEEFMAQHPIGDKNFKNVSFEATTFGSPGFEGFLLDAADDRISNIRISGDPVSDHLERARFMAIMAMSMKSKVHRALLTAQSLYGNVSKGIRGSVVCRLFS